MIHIVDRISILPDHLLHSVLSLCTLPVCNLITKLFQLYSFAYSFALYESGKKPLHACAERGFRLNLVSHDPVI